MEALHRSVWRVRDPTVTTKRRVVKLYVCACDRRQLVMLVIVIKDSHIEEIVMKEFQEIVENIVLY